MSRRYPSRPIAGVGAVILEGDSVLLVRRGNEPMRGFWSLPGGALELGERLIDGLRREIREEVGLEVNVVDVVEVLDRVIRDEAGKVQYHYVLIDYLCSPTGGSLRAGSDADDAVWVERDRVGERQTTEGAAPVIAKAFELRERLSVRA